MKEEIWYRLSTAILKTGVRKTAGTAAGKLASLSVRAKTTLGIISPGAVTAVGGTTYAVVTQNSDTEGTQKATYRDVLSDPSSYTQHYPSDTDFNSI